MMRVLELIMALVIVAVLAVVVGIAMPGSGHVERSLVIGKDMRQVYDVLNNFRRFPEYAELTGSDPQIKYDLSGEAYGPGAEISWTGNAKKAGERQAHHRQRHAGVQQDRRLGQGCQDRLEPRRRLARQRQAFHAGPGAFGSQQQADQGDLGLRRVVRLQPDQPLLQPVHPRRAGCVHPVQPDRPAEHDGLGEERRLQRADAVHRADQADAGADGLHQDRSRGRPGRADRDHQRCGQAAAGHGQEAQGERDRSAHPRGEQLRRPDLLVRHRAADRCHQPDGRRREPRPDGCRPGGQAGRPGGCGLRRSAGRAHPPPMRRPLRPRPMRRAAWTSTVA